jgi:hypothetical protein
MGARRKFLGPDHPDTLTSRNNLAAARQAAGRSTGLPERQARKAAKHGSPDRLA